MSRKGVKIVPEQRERMEKALHGCAEVGAPDTVDLWSEIRERVSVEPRPARRFRLVPRTRVGWVFAALIMMLLTMGAYAGSKWVYNEFQGELPGGDAAKLGEKLYLTKTMEEARVTVEWAYADTKFVVVGFSVEDLKSERKDYENDAELQPFLGGGPPGALPSDLGGLTGESGKNFPMIDGTTFVSDAPFMLRGPVANTAVKVPENLEPNKEHRFHLEIPLEELPVFGRGTGVVRDEPDPLIGPFGPNGEIELVDTLTPHIGGTIEFYRPDLDNGSLDIAATQTGYTSHRIYTRNLDTARAGDLDGDGRWELLVPNDDYTELGAIRHETDGATVAWTLPVDGTIVTNLASATNSEGRAQVAAGREDAVLRIWP